jgi:hypothetical protein
LDCEINSYSPPSSPVCLTCTQGSYINPNYDGCIRCPPGKINLFIKGTYQPQNIKTSCLFCPKGTYNTNYGSIDCNKCEINKTCNFGSIVQFKDLITEQSIVDPKNSIDADITQETVSYIKLGVLLSIIVILIVLSIIFILSFIIICKKKFRKFDYFFAEKRFLEYINFLIF